jgi:predicted PhzF superfamily epimerase YddE/YHI9
VAELHVLRVFCAEDGTGGNPLGVFLDGSGVPEAERQAVAAELGYSETVFVEDREANALRIFTPEVELPLAGHPLVGTAWLLREKGSPAEALRPPAGRVGVRYEGELPFVSADPEWAPRFDFVEVASPTEVDQLAGPPEGRGMVGVWAWAEEADTIRERVFAPEAGVSEDEATGAAAMRLVAQIGRPIQIRQGRTAGSLIYARPLEDGRVEVGGRVELDLAGGWSAGDGRPTP